LQHDIKNFFLLPCLTQSEKAIIIPAGSLDSDPLEEPIQHIYYHDKPAWSGETDNLPHFDGLPTKKIQQP